MPNTERSSSSDARARQALAQLATPIYRNYMHRPVTESFDWPAIVAHAQTIAEPTSGTYYLVVFRSTLKPDTDRELVRGLDEAAHNEAKASASLMYYFAGDPMEMTALSWCLWTDMNEARKALAGTAHRSAASKAGDLYDSFKIELYNVAAAGGQVQFEPVSKVRA